MAIRKETNYIIIHHTASSRDKTTFQEVRKWHVEGNGWSNIGYHYLITADGYVHIGRLIEEVGANCKGHNHESIGICLTGNFMNEEPTWRQLESLRDLISKLRKEFPNAEVKAHRDLAATACPGDNLYNKL